MSQKMTVIVHDVEKDGLPTDDRFADHDLTDRCAFLFLGHLYSGWPTLDNCWLRLDGDDTVPKAGVRYWVEFPMPIRGLSA